VKVEVGVLVAVLVPVKVAVLMDVDVAVEVAVRVKVVEIVKVGVSVRLLVGLGVAVRVGVEVMTGVIVPVEVTVAVEVQGVPLAFMHGVSVGPEGWVEADEGEVGSPLPQLQPMGMELKAIKTKITRECFMPISLIVLKPINLVILNLCIGSPRLRGLIIRHPGV
jgi:hypothetical protein